MNEAQTKNEATCCLKRYSASVNLVRDSGHTPGDPKPYLAGRRDELGQYRRGFSRLLEGPPVSDTFEHLDLCAEHVCGLPAGRVVPERIAAARSTRPGPAVGRRGSLQSA